MKYQELSKIIIKGGLLLAIPLIACFLIVQPQTDKVFVEKYSIETFTDNLNRTTRYVKFVQPETNLIETLPYSGTQGDHQGVEGTLIIHRSKTYDTQVSEVK